MSDWIKQLANKERERRNRINDFQKAVPDFLEILTKALECDAQQYRQEFPGADIVIYPDKEKGSIRIVCSAYNPSTSATVQMHSERQHVSCSYQSATSRDWEDMLQISTLGIHSIGVDPNYTAAQLSKKILKPVLFPAL